MELRRITQARDYRLSVEHNDRMTLAYVIESMHRVKKLTTKQLSRVQVNLKKPSKGIQSATQQIAIATMWASLGYGKMRKKEQINGGG